MSTPDRVQVVATVIALLCWSAPSDAADAGYGLGRAATGEEIARWNIDVRADGAGLPPGSGTVFEGEGLYARRCAACHGPRAEGGPMDRLVGGQGSLAAAKPVRTIGSFWPHATTLFDYVRRTMPFDAPQSLTTNEVYALTAYLLFLNQIVPESTTLDAATLPYVPMPNRLGFTDDPRPDVR